MQAQLKELLASIHHVEKKQRSEALNSFCAVGFFSHILSHLCPDLLLIPAISHDLLSPPLQLFNAPKAPPSLLSRGSTPGKHSVTTGS